MTGELIGKTAVITGATRGFGRALGNAFGWAQANLAICSRSEASVDQALVDLRASGIEAIGMPCDVSRLDQVRSLAEFTIDHFGSYEIWINNAGLSAPYGPSVHIQPGEFQAVIYTNILGVYNGSITAMQHFLPRRTGTLINITGRGDRGPQPMQNAYASSKAWMRSFTESLAREYQNSGVKLYAFNPGMMRTDMTQQVSAVQGYENRLEILDTVLRVISVSPEASAQTAVRLASSAANRRHKTFVRQMTVSQMAGGGAARAGQTRLQKNR